MSEEKLSDGSRESILYELRRSFAILNAEIPEKAEIKGFEVPLRDIVLEIRTGKQKKIEYILSLIEGINEAIKKHEARIYEDITVEEALKIKDLVLGLKRARAELESEISEPNGELEDTKRFYGLIKRIKE